MNKNELQAEMKRRGFTYETISKAMGISENAFWRKVNGFNDFTLSEIQSIIRILKLNSDKMRTIFFN